MVTLEPFLQRKVHLHYQLKLVAPLVTKFLDKISCGSFMHRINRPPADVHPKLQKFDVDSLLLSPERRIHHHQIHLLLSQSQSRHIRMNQVVISTFNFLLQLLLSHSHILFIYLYPERKRSSNVNQSSQYHTRSHS